LTSEYSFPILANAEGFVRGLFGYQPENKNASLTFTAPSYALLDLFAGVRLPDKGWEFSVYGRNITDTDKTLNESAGFVAAAAGLEQTFGQTGYRTATFTPEREFGVSARFAFGSR
jgi:iron complex outermembrane receptor protein